MLLRVCGFCVLFVCIDTRKKISFSSFLVNDVLVTLINGEEADFPGFMKREKREQMYTHCELDWMSDGIVTNFSQFEVGGNGQETDGEKRARTGLKGQEKKKQRTSCLWIFRHPILPWFFAGVTSCPGVYAWIPQFRLLTGREERESGKERKSEWRDGVPRHVINDAVRVEKMDWLNSRITCITFTQLLGFETPFS